jgi:putrescine transport system substrate-binding protein
MKRVVLACALALATLGMAEAQQRVLNVYNWSDYIDPKLLQRFTQETGIRVVYDTYDSNEILETKLLAGSTGYDIVVPSGTFLQRQIKAGVFQPLDRSKLKNAGNIWPEIDQRLATYDAGNRHAVNYMWFTTGLAYDERKVSDITGGKPLDSWDILFKPEELKKFASCGVYVLDSPEDLFSIALKYLGSDPDTTELSKINAATDLLAKMRPHVKKFHSSEYINALAGGDICLAVAWAGDAYQARNRAREAGKAIDIKYVIPREGTLMSMDNLAIPKDARNVEAAYAFIDFLLRPDVAAQNTAITNYANGVKPSQSLIPKDIIEDRSIYPDESMLGRIFTIKPRELATQRLVTRAWTRVKTGR